MTTDGLRRYLDRRIRITTRSALKWGGRVLDATETYLIIFDDRSGHEVMVASDEIVLLEVLS